MNRRLLLPALCSLLLAFSGCATQRAEIKAWWGNYGQANVQATVALLASEAAQIAERTVYSQGLSATDVLLKNQNVQGFGDGLRTLESGLAPAAIEQIPDFVMHLRQIWLPPQQHYTDLAANLGTLLQTEDARLSKLQGHPLSSDQTKQIVEGLIKGLQTQPPALKAP